VETRSGFDRLGLRRAANPEPAEGWGGLAKQKTFSILLLHTHLRGAPRRLKRLKPLLQLL
jgi:hypothetical protein